MFFRRPNTNAPESKEQSRCEDEIALLRIKADEKCRMYKERRVVYDLPNYDEFIWSKNECIKASDDVVNQVNSCLSLRRQNSGD